MPATNQFQKKYSERDGSSCYIDPDALQQAKTPGYQHKLAALSHVHFKVPASERSQYLDVGCGSGGFTKDALLDYVRPCRRIVAVDRSETLIKYAQEHASHPDISYELADIEVGDPQPLLAKYGAFSRVYSFLALQCVRDLKAAYRNMFHFLEDGGECAIVSLTGSTITDVMYQLGNMEQWRDYVPDPRELYSERFLFCQPAVQEKVISTERDAVLAAGLELVSCSVYDSMWTLPNIDAWIDTYVPAFKLEAKIPEEKRSTFRQDCRALLEAKTTMTPEGCAMRHGFVVVHAQKPARN
ncbi:uncharacterized protein LOC144141156 [Haemaphysalis longicornis]